LPAAHGLNGHDGGSDVVTSLGTLVPWLARCSVFKDRTASARRDSPAATSCPERRPTSISADAGSLRSKERRTPRSATQS